jgi:bud site selection protein 31
MPPIRTSRNRKPPPEGFDDIEDTLLEFSNKMKDAENASHEGKKRHEVLWPIFQICHQREFPFLALSQHSLLTRFITI